MGDLIRRLCGHLTPSFGHPSAVDKKKPKYTPFTKPEIAKLIKWSNPDPPTKHDRGVLIRVDGETKALEGGNVSPFHEVVIGPFDVIIHQDVSHQALKFVHCKESTRAVKEVSLIFDRYATKH